MEWTRLGPGKADTKEGWGTVMRNCSCSWGLQSWAALELGSWTYYHGRFWICWWGAISAKARAIEKARYNSLLLCPHNVVSAHSATEGDLHVSESEDGCSLSSSCSLISHQCFLLSGVVRRYWPCSQSQKYRVKHTRADVGLKDNRWVTSRWTEGRIQGEEERYRERERQAGNKGKREGKAIGYYTKDTKWLFGSSWKGVFYIFWQWQYIFVFKNVIIFK